MPLLPITALYSALLAFVLLHLAYQVVKVRQRHKAGLGHKNDELLVAGRSHANATEYIPITLILLALAELNGAPNFLLHVIGSAFFVSRILHAWGFVTSKGLTHAGRYWGTLGTFVCLMILSLLNLYLCWPYL